MNWLNCILYILYIIRRIITYIKKLLFVKDHAAMKLAAFVVLLYIIADSKGPVLLLCSCFTRAYKIVR